MSDERMAYLVGAGVQIVTLLAIVAGIHLCEWREQRAFERRHQRPPAYRGQLLWPPRVVGSTYEEQGRWAPPFRWLGTTDGGKR
jgi:hypothetical protein